ncbi:6-phosphofructokinase, putative [Citrifermentans bemidjiense Bem]|uniref:6-phosphofructokinase, putative n=1 Tax=Citrifermentans bemidjiense (strain ATCC BAA-1014 / DSM 16622 / JCM 12645 / Bem) TaxID=404380 RepID=B5E9Q7_CITBB|nr:1-phosphofructokinase family hexose kinase [Citrifermentans bemidjiense]ACH40231.1 6-phosphofructokinase, putative [Citrifermentans bemidjiense Bem]
MKTIVTITMNPAIDKSATVDHVVAERKLYCSEPLFEPGGGGINVSRAVRKLGGESLALYPSGGHSGQTLRLLLDQEGLTHRPIEVAGWTRENLIVLESATGQQYRFGMPGPDLSAKEWQACLEQIFAGGARPDYLVASGSLPPGVPQDFYARIARLGKQHGARVVVDASGEPMRLALREGVFLIKPNIREFREMIGEGGEDEARVLALAKKIVLDGQSEVVVISLGAAGVLMVSDSGVERLHPPTVPIISKVGAGDSMVAGMVLSLARGNTLRDAVRFGVAAGTAAVMTPGTELCRREDAERLYRQMLPGE